MFKTHVEYTFNNMYPVVLKNSELCNFRTFSSFQKEAPYSSAVTHHFFPNPLPLDNYLFTFLIHWPIVDI